MLQELFCIVPTVADRFGHFLYPASFVDRHIACYYCVGGRYFRNYSNFDSFQTILDKTSATLPIT
jgi:hypothetical protein